MTIRHRLRAALHVLRGRPLVAAVHLVDHAAVHRDERNVLIVGTHVSGAR